MLFSPEFSLLSKCGHFRARIRASSLDSRTRRAILSTVGAGLSTRRLVVVEVLSEG
jgi:hypothetical protein